MPSGDASGCGFLTSDPFVYGYGGKGISSNNETDIKENNSTFTSIAGSLNDYIDRINTINENVKNQNLSIATPAMSHGAFLSDGCAGMPISKTDDKTFTNKIPSDKNKPAIFYTQNLCDNGEYNGYPCSNGACDGNCGCKSNGNLVQCACNGWLELSKYGGDPSTKQVKPWWNKCNIINIHCYNRYAHLVKIHILEYVALYYDDIKNGKEIWLTECAHVPSIKDKQVIPSDSKRNAKFLYDLLWKETSNDDINKSCIGKNIQVEGKLPGIRTDTTFSFNYGSKKISGNWSKLGLGGFTWFSSTNLYGFNTCMDSNNANDQKADNSSSSIWSNGILNEIWKILISKTDPGDPTK